MNDTTQLSGTIERFIYQDIVQGFSICVVHVSSAETVIAKGTLSHLTPGVQVLLTGAWIVHPKFGQQFEVQTCQTILPTSKEGLIRYLGSGLIRGIGPTYAEKLVAQFGTEVLDVIEKQPHLLQKIPGIGPKRLEKIINAWSEQKEIANIMVFLQEKEISPAYASKIYKTYGNQTIDIVTHNPYRLAEDVWGIGFSIADQIATHIGIASNAPERLKAGILFAIKQETDAGHLYVEIEELKTKTITLLKLEQNDTIDILVKNALRSLYEQQKIIVLFFENQHFIATQQHYLIEKAIAKKVKTLCSYQSSLQIPFIDTLQALEQKTLILNEEQKNALSNCLQHKVSIITGGPGTGKTTIIKILLDVLDQHNISYLLAAPTGRAAKKITESTGKAAQTIHRLLEFDVSTYQFSKNEANALKAHYIIVDEASMIDIFLAHSLLKAVSLDSHIVFIGDIDQLPSVGAGNFLVDLIASKIIFTTRLITIFRQAQQSLITMNAHRINQGKSLIWVSENTKKDFIFIKEDDPLQIKAHIETILYKHLPQHNIALSDSIVLSPMNRGTTGTQLLNKTLQQIVNPFNQQTVQITHNHITFTLHDRVMQLRNNYDKLIFNGDIGSVESINTEDATLSVRFGTQIVTYETHELDELTLAYAITIHKSQGSEFPAVIIPLFMQHYMLLQRNLIYTAITRAKKLCFCIGQLKALHIAINNNKSILRKTFLKEYLISDLESR